MFGTRVNDLLEKIERRILKEEIMKGYCEKCGSKKNLTIHHIKKVAEYPELKNNPDNCITLCKKCHQKIHQKE